MMSPVLSAEVACESDCQPGQQMYNHHDDQCNKQLTIAVAELVSTVLERVAGKQGKSVSSEPRQVSISLNCQGPTRRIIRSQRTRACAMQIACRPDTNQEGSRKVV